MPSQLIFSSAKQLRLTLAALANLSQLLDIYLPSVRTTLLFQRSLFNILSEKNECGIHVKVRFLCGAMMWPTLASWCPSNDVISRDDHRGFILKMLSPPKCVVQTEQLLSQLSATSEQRECDSEAAATRAARLMLPLESGQRVGEGRFLPKTSTETRGGDMREAAR